MIASNTNNCILYHGTKYCQEFAEQSLTGWQQIALAVIAVIGLIFMMRSI